MLGDVPNVAAGRHCRGLAVVTVPGTVSFQASNLPLVIVCVKAHIIRL